MRCEQASSYLWSSYSKVAMFLSRCQQPVKMPQIIQLHTVSVPPESKLAIHALTLMLVIIIDEAVKAMKVMKT